MSDSPNQSADRRDDAARALQAVQQALQVALDRRDNGGAGGAAGEFQGT
jgi:hypothetical protein